MLEAGRRKETAPLTLFVTLVAWQTDVKQSYRLHVYVPTGLARRVGARLLITSTSEVYGDPEVHPQHEDYWGHVNPIGPRSCYDEGKRVAESLCYAYQKQVGTEIKGLLPDFLELRLTQNFVQLTNVCSTFMSGVCVPALWQSTYIVGRHDQQKNDVSTSANSSCV